MFTPTSILEYYCLDLILLFWELVQGQIDQRICGFGNTRKIVPHAFFHKPYTKLWLYDTVVTPAMLYGIQIWGPSLDQESRSVGTYDGWRSMEKLLISMILWMF